MKKLSQFRPGKIHYHFFPKTKKPADINKGDCYIWAYVAYQMFQGVELWSRSCHAFVKYKGKFYDSERLTGVEDWKDLPTCASCNECGGAKAHTPEEFRAAWWIPSYLVSYKKIEQDVKRVLSHG